MRTRPDGTFRFYEGKRDATKTLEEYQRHTEKIDALVKQYYKGKITLGAFKEGMRKLLI